MKKRAGLIFDKDGTLFDFNATWGGWTRSMLKAETRGDAAMTTALAQALGYDMNGRRFLPGSIVIAEPVHIFADTILKVTGQTDKPALIARLNAQGALVKQQPAADLPALLAQLSDSGYRLGIATNDTEGPARRHLQAEGIEEMFDFIAGSDSGFGHKPNPGQLLAFCAQTGIAANDCAMIGDSTHDLIAGRAAGMTCIGVLTGPAPLKELSPHADIVLDSIADLPGWLDRVR